MLECAADGQDGDADDVLAYSEEDEEDTWFDWGYLY